MDGNHIDDKMARSRTLLSAHNKEMELVPSRGRTLELDSEVRVLSLHFSPIIQPSTMCFTDTSIKHSETLKEWSRIHVKINQFINIFMVH